MAAAADCCWRERVRSTECCSSSAACTSSASSLSRTSFCGQCDAPMRSIISRAVWLNGSLQRPWQVTRLPNQRGRLATLPQPWPLGLTRSRKRSTNAGVLLVQYLRPIRIRSFWSGTHTLLEIVPASITAETQCGSDAAVLYKFIRSTAELSSRLNGGLSDSSAAERVPSGK